MRRNRKDGIDFSLSRIFGKYCRDLCSNIHLPLKHTQHIKSIFSPLCDQKLLLKWNTFCLEMMQNNVSFANVWFKINGVFPQMLIFRNSFGVMQASTSLKYYGEIMVSIVGGKLSFTKINQQIKHFLPRNEAFSSSLYQRICRSETRNLIKNPNKNLFVTPFSFLFTLLSYEENN